MIDPHAFNHPSSSDPATPRFLAEVAAAKERQRAAREVQARPPRIGIDLAAEELKALAEREADRDRSQAAEQKAAAERASAAIPPAHILIFTPINIFAALVLGIALGGTVAVLGSSLATDYLVGHCLWPGMACEAGVPVFGGGE